jgi:hypothetical protein
MAARTIFTDFCQLANLSAHQQYLVNHVTTSKTQRKKTEATYKKCSLNHSLNVDGQIIQVCKILFTYS